MVNIGYIFRIYRFFFENKQRFIELFPELFDGGTGFKSRTEEEFANKWSWLAWLDGLAGNDITKLNKILKKPAQEVLLWLCYQIDKAKLENNKQK